MPGKIIFLIPYPTKTAPSQRFRFEQYLTLLRDQGFKLEIHTFLNSQAWKIFYKPDHILEKLIALIKGFVRRLFILFRVSSFDFIFIHREATPVGPPVFEWIIAVLLRKRIIYDFDDAIWLTDNLHEPLIFRMIKWRGKVPHICRLSYKISCGNNFLCAYARRYNDMVILNPTTIDSQNLHLPSARQAIPNDKTIYIGWTGSHSTLKYLNLIENVLNRLQNSFKNVYLIVIADQKPELNLPRMIFLPWNITTEIEDLQRIDIGVMPLYEDDWEKGKCGFKALQYMALEIPSVISPVGMNKDLVVNGKNGFLADTEEEWYEFLRLLIVDENLRLKIGRTGREKVISDFSVQSNSLTFLSLFE